MSARTSSCHACEEIVLQYAKLGGSHSVQTPRDFAMVRSWRKSPLSACMPKVILLDAADPLITYSNHRRCSMGDKSRKSKERQKKQDTAQKSQKKADALAKANPPPTTPLKRGK